MTSLKESIKKLKLEELITLARNVNYIAPNKLVNEYTEDEICFGSINILIHNEILLKGMSDTLNAYPPLKLLLKSNLKNYIEFMVNLNNTESISSNCV